MKNKQAVLGIDIAKETFAAAVSLPEHEHWLQQDYRSTAAGHHRLQQWLVGQNAQPCRVGMEATGNYGYQLLQSLHGNGYQCSLLQPLKVKRHMPSARARQQD